MTFVIGAFVFVGLGVNAAFERREKRRLEAFGLAGVPIEIARRHLKISAAMKPVRVGRDVPVHIMQRKSDSSPWALCGTGTKLNKAPGFVLTAHHAFEGRSMQYGVRIISSREASGEEPIIPIVSVDFTRHSDDSVICAIDPAATSFPKIDVPSSESMFREWQKDKKYVVKTYFTNVRLLTEPDKVVRALFHIEVLPGVYHIVLERDTVAGENGTGATMEGQSPGTYLVVVSQFIMPTDIVDRLSPESKKQVDWHPEKRYTLARLVKVTSPAP